MLESDIINHFLVNFIRKAVNREKIEDIDVGLVQKDSAIIEMKARRSSEIKTKVTRMQCSM
tara:strand:+ start:717 stop:899 length:183 start_codon:yes stop_codon:yes gene_type:complete